MKAKFRRTDALLLLPILLLGGVGYWQQQRAQKLREPTRIEVRSLQVLPPTPSDVARGFDTRVRVSVGYRGAVPHGWGVTNVSDYKKPIYGLTSISSTTASQTKNSRQKPIAVRNDSNRFDAKNDVYFGTYLMKLRDIPSNAPVTLNGNFQANELKQTPQGWMNVTTDAKDLNWNTVVRSQGVKTAVPQVSRYSGLTLKKIELYDKRVGKSTANFMIYVTCELAPTLVDERPITMRINSMLHDVYLTDAAGRRFGGPGNSIMPQYVDKNNESSGAKAVMIAFYNWQTLPADTSNLTFHAQISVDDYWPLEINIPVKDIPPFQ